MFFPAASRSTGNKCPYRSRVSVAVLWPSIRCSVFTCTPPWAIDVKTDPVDTDPGGAKLGGDRIVLVNVDPDERLVGTEHRGVVV
jgi:hypothetical protein